MPPKITPSQPVQRAIDQLGQRLREARLRRNITIEEVAHKLGVARQTVAEAETGNAGTSVAIYAGCLWAMGLLDQVSDLAALGREPVKVLEQMPKRLRARRRAG